MKLETKTNRTKYEEMAKEIQHQKSLMADMEVKFRDQKDYEEIKEQLSCISQLDIMDKFSSRTEYYDYHFYIAPYASNDLKDDTSLPNWESCFKRRRNVERGRLEKINLTIRRRDLKVDKSLVEPAVKQFWLNLLQNRKKAYQDNRNQKTVEQFEELLAFLSNASLEDEKNVAFAYKEIAHAYQSWKQAYDRHSSDATASHSEHDPNLWTLKDLVPRLLPSPFEAEIEKYADILKNE